MRAFQQLAAIAKVKHVEGRGWYGLPRVATDLAESATADDRVKDWLGGWQDSETRKQIYQDRQTDELRAEAAKVRRALRLGAQPATAAKDSATANGSHPGAQSAVDLDALLAALTVCAPCETTIPIARGSSAFFPPPRHSGG